MSSLKLFPRYLRRHPPLPFAHRRFSILKNPESSPLVQSTRKWFQSVVLQEKLCPFAPPLVGNDKLRIVKSDAHTDDAMVQDVKQEVESLMMSPTVTHETTLVVFSRDMPFLDFVRLSWRLQEEAVADHVEDLQLVLFHPHATHQTYSEMTSASDYTIRSPYPTVHLLREVDVMKAVQSGYPDLADLPARNKEKLEKQGLKVCEQRLAACYTTDDEPKPS
jgi:hypothetical protein